MFLPYILASVGLYVVGDALGKLWAVQDNWMYFWAGLLLYMIGGAFAFYAIREASLSLALIVMPPLATIFGLATGRFIFGEELSALQYLMAAVILVAMVVLLWNPKF